MYYIKQLSVLLGRTAVPELAKGQKTGGEENKEDNTWKDKQIEAERCRKKRETKR